MRYASNLLAWLALGLVSATAASKSLAGPDRTWNVTEVFDLPKCVTQCAQTVLGEYACPLLDAATSLPSDCFCANKGPLADKLSNCILEGCPTLPEALKGVKFQALTCDYPRDRDKTATLLGTTVALFSLTTLFLTARFLSRWPRLSGAGLSWDDGIVLVCFIPVVGITIVSCKIAHLGGGKDSWTLPDVNVIKIAKWFWAVLPIYLAAVFCTKLSLVALYLRIWPTENGHSSRFRITCWITAGALVATALACSLSMIFACHPISNAWRYADSAMGTCTHRVNAGIAYGGINVLFDIIVIALPIHRLMRLEVSIRQKIGILSCFLVGFIATACSVIRLTQFNGLYTGRNITWDYLPTGLWSLIEVYCSMICCCMPSMAGLIQRFWRRSPWTTNDSRAIPSFEMVSHTEKDRSSETYSYGYGDVATPSPTKLVESAKGGSPENVEHTGFVTYMPTAKLPPGDSY